jgi:hypothetical protein
MVCREKLSSASLVKVRPWSLRGDHVAGHWCYQEECSVTSARDLPFTPAHRAHSGLSTKDRLRHTAGTEWRLPQTYLSCPNPIDFHADLW